MLVSHMLKSRIYNDLLFGGCGYVPSIGKDLFMSSKRFCLPDGKVTLAYLVLIAARNLLDFVASTKS